MAKQLVLLTYTPRKLDEEEYAKFIREIDYPAFRQNPMAVEMAHYPLESLKREKNLLLITSTYGDGEPPDNAATFWEFLKSEQTPALPQLR